MKRILLFSVVISSLLMLMFSSCDNYDNSISATSIIHNHYSQKIDSLSNSFDEDSIPIPEPVKYLIKLNESLLMDYQEPGLSKLDSSTVYAWVCCRLQCRRKCWVEEEKNLEYLTSTVELDKGQIEDDSGMKIAVINTEKFKKLRNGTLVYKFEKRSETIPSPFNIRISKKSKQGDFLGRYQIKTKKDTTKKE